jgi:zinc transport system substrate-binding protein
MPRFNRFAPVGMMVLVALTGCSQPAAAPPSAVTSPNQSASVEPQSNLPQSNLPQKRLQVVATFLPVYLFTKAVAGDVADVKLLIKPGSEVHEYQSTPGDVQTLAQAQVVVKNGLGIEEFLDETLKSAQNPALKVIDASREIKPIQELSQVVKAKADEHDHQHEGGNPHVWLDPVLAKQQVEAIRDGLMAADPANQAKYKANAAAYIQQLDQLNQEFEQSLRGYRDRTFVTFHDAFPYLAKRYQLQQVAVVEIPEDQLSPADVQETIKTVKQFQVKALFGEPGIDNKLLTGLAQDLKLTLRPLDSLEAGQPDPQYYFTAMRNNLQTLQAAFK